jgi:pyrroloquinoline quinone biosynthesis protein B
LRILVLGSAAGGGFPQWNCNCPVCQLAWSGDPRVRSRSQSSLAVSADGERWLLLNASPDLRQQIIDQPRLHPRGASRQSPISVVFVTNGDIDHIAGLLVLREQHGFTLFGSNETLSEVAGASVFAVLNKALVQPRPVELGSTVDTGIGLKVTPFPVPGKIPLYRESAIVDVGAEGESTVGLEISDGVKSFFYVPGCSDVNDRVWKRLRGADLLFFDGTTYTDDEMVVLDVSPKTAHRMGHVAMSGKDGSLDRFASSEIARKIYVHINNTNPVLIEDSKQRASVVMAGWEVAYDGMEVEL